MSKKIIQRMCDISEKMRQLDGNGIELSPENYRRAATDLRALENTLGLTRMQVLILTGIVEKSSSYWINANDIAKFLGMDYLHFLALGDDLDTLRKKGYIRIDGSDRIMVPSETKCALKEDRPVEPEVIKGLSTGRILSRMRRKFGILSNGQMRSLEALREIEELLDANPDTSIARVCRKRLADICNEECLVFYALVFKYYCEDDDMMGWMDLDDYFEEDDLEDLKGAYRAEALDLQREGLIECVGQDGMMSRDFFHIKDDIKEELLADVGGLKKKQVNLGASQKISAVSIAEKELFYNPAEARQVATLDTLMSEERFSDIRRSMKEKKYRTGFTCLFYGGPGTGKTETVYQIARRSGRDLFSVDVSQVKSCWVGESEKNIKEVFRKYRECVKTAARVPILLFNEADAIFGIRREGAGSAVDKMENSIQNIILQEMEDLDGILIATTNLTCNLDKAFERRFLYKVRFEKPSTEAKTRIWRSMMPSLSEEEALTLASAYDFSGGQIENIVRKKEVKSLISGEEPTFDQIREYCDEEVIGDRPERKRRIGF